MRGCCDDIRKAGLYKDRSRSIMFAFLLWLVGYVVDIVAVVFSFVSISCLYWWVVCVVTLLLLFGVKDRVLKIDINISMYVFAIFFFCAGCCFLDKVCLISVGVFFLPVLKIWFEMFFGSLILLLSLNIADFSDYFFVFRVCVAQFLFAFVLVFFSVSSLFVGLSVVFSWALGVFFGICCLKKTWDGLRSFSLEDSVSIVLLSSWLYSAFNLGMTTFFGVGVGGYFFCDCWKILGAVLFSRSFAKSEEGFLVESASFLERSKEKVQSVMRVIVPFVFAYALASYVIWFHVFNGAAPFAAFHIFQSVMISSCPCVTTLAVPLVYAKYINKKEDVGATDDHIFSSCVDSNVGLVIAYYIISLLLSGGGAYVLFGFWMQPWHSGLLMFLGQGVLWLNTERLLGKGFFSGIRSFYHVCKGSKRCVLYIVKGAGIKSGFLKRGGGFAVKIINNNFLGRGREEANSASQNDGSGKCKKCSCG